jgi:predicted RNA-binding Zn ribbon-like protein
MRVTLARSTVLLQVNFRRYTFQVPFDALAENLVNSHDLTLEVPEHLQTPADLSAFLREHDIDWPRRLGAADLEQVKRLRGRVRELFEADTQTAAANSLNELLVGARARMKVVKDRVAPRIDWTVDTSVELAEALRSAVAVSVAHLVTQFGFDRLRVCGGTPCADVFLDVSKRGAQRFCGPRCATRVRVAAHRARL